jgi:DNA-binding response OmpR family regulator
VSTLQILSVGSDPELMSTRTLVLLSAGYQVDTSSTAEQALQVFAHGNFAAVIICHSIPEPQRITLIKGLRALRPDVPIIVIRIDGEISARLADRTVHSLDGAPILLDAVASSLNARGR